MRLLAAVATLSALSLACSGDDDAKPSGTVTWCEVRQVLQEKCQRCHVGDGEHGAPFPLESYADTQVEMGSRKRWEFMQAAVEGGTMPPPGIELEPPAEKPTAAERELLLSWFEEGAKPLGGESCD